MSSKMQSGSPRARRTRLVATITAVLLVAAITAVASAISITNVDGVWGNPTPSSTSNFRWCRANDNTTGPAGAPADCDTGNPNVQNQGTNPTTDENQWRYGNPQSGTGSAYRSGYGFNGVNGVSNIPSGTPFYLGRFTHYNFPITADNTLTGISLTVTLSGIVCDNNVPPTQGSNLSFTYNFQHDETDNNANPCAYPTGPNENGCADRVLLTNPQPSETFMCSDGTYTLQILGFQTGANCSTSWSGSGTNVFLTRENDTNSACLWAEITAPQAVTLNAFDAQWQNESVRVSWETASEMDNLGFNIYRSSSPDQLGERVNEQMIPAQGTGSGMGYSYTLDDTNVTPGTTYWYFLEDVDTNGNTVRHGPVSAEPAAPTAVTISTVDGQSGSPMPWIVGAGLMLLLAGGVVRQRMTR